MNPIDPLYLVKEFDKTPPCSWRGMAIEASRGKKTRRLFIRELVAKSGIPKRTLLYAIYKTSAAGMTLEQISRISAACGVNMLSRNPLFNFIRSHPSGDTEFLHPRQKKRLNQALAIWEKQRARK